MEANSSPPAFGGKRTQQTPECKERKLVRQSTSSQVDEDDLANEVVALRKRVKELEGHARELEGKLVEEKRSNGRPCAACGHQQSVDDCFERKSDSNDDRSEDDGDAAALDPAKAAVAESERAKTASSEGDESKPSPEDKGGAKKKDRAGAKAVQESEATGSASTTGMGHAIIQYRGPIFRYGMAIIAGRVFFDQGVKYDVVWPDGLLESGIDGQFVAEVPQLPHAHPWIQQQGAKNVLVGEGSRQAAGGSRKGKKQGEALAAGESGRDAPKRLQSPKLCKIEGCDKQSQGGRCDYLCKAHFSQLNPGAPNPMAPRRCSHEDCTKYAQGGCKGLCRAHYTKENNPIEISSESKSRQTYYFYDDDEPFSKKRPRKKQVHKKCAFEGCDKMSQGRRCDNFCKRHYVMINPDAEPTHRRKKKESM